MQDLWRDIRIAVRTLAKSPAHTVLAIVTIGLGIGATTAVFSMVRAALLRRLPYGGGDRLVQLVQSSATAPDVLFSVPEVADYRDRAGDIEAASEYHSMPFQLYGRGEPQRVQTGVVSDNFFTLLGVRPLLGRVFQPGEDAVGAPAVVVLGYRYWMDRMGGDPNIVGSTFTMNDHVHTIVGVLPPLPAYPDANDIWMPAGACPFRSAPAMMGMRAMRMLRLFARLRPAVTLGHAAASVGVVSRALHASYPAAYPVAEKLDVSTVALREDLTRESRPLLLTLLATAAFVLLIAAANFANLSLVRQIRRGRELSLRAALGAGRGRLLRQLVIESLCITLSGGVLAVAIAASGLGLLRSLASRVTSRADEITMDLGVLGFAFAASIVVGVVVALVPLLRVRPDLNAALRAGSVTTTSSRGDSRARNLLIVLQVATAYVLLIGAGLMTRSLVRLERLDGGYDVSHVMTARVDLNWSRYTSGGTTRAFADGLVTRLANQPGVVSVALSSDFPLNSSQPSRVPFDVRGRAMVPGQPRPSSDVTIASPAYFRTLGVPILRGRAFTDADRDTTNVPVVIGQRLAARYWSGRDALGEQITFDEGRHWATIVGIAGDVRQNGLSRGVTDEVYVPFSANATTDLRVLIRTTSEPALLATRIRAAVKELDDKQPVTDVRTYGDLRDLRLTEPRATTALLVSFAALALIITAGGLAGAIGYAVSQRTTEIGIRVALGAPARNVLWTVIRQGVAVVAVGVAVGLWAAVTISPRLGSLLFAVEPTDVGTYAAVAGVFLAVAFAACMFPARRALRVDPVEAFRVRA
jgi:putative ABC transport system permease protein